MSVQTGNSNYSSDWLDFFTQELLYPWLRPPLRWSRSGSRYGLNNNLFMDSSPLWDRTKYASKVWHDCQTCVMMKTCVMTSHVRGSAIFDWQRSVQHSMVWQPTHGARWNRNPSTGRCYSASESFTVCWLRVRCLVVGDWVRSTPSLRPTCSSL